jgi:ubiquinone/menaquinone biosynthesis C-methylase UbiE
MARTILLNGCGKGTTSILLAKKYGCNVVGLDLSEDLLSQAATLVRRKGQEKKISFRVGNALNMPFADKELDRVIGQSVLILVSDKKKAVQEALRVTKPGGYVGWLELSWKKPITKEFLDGVSNVICAYCMLGVETFENWSKLCEECGVKELQTSAYSQEFRGLSGMMGDEGFINGSKIMFKYLTKSRIRNRMKTMDEFFRGNDWNYSQQTIVKPGFLSRISSPLSSNNGLWHISFPQEQIFHAL